MMKTSYQQGIQSFAVSCGHQDAQRKRAIRGIAIVFESTLGDAIKRQAMDTVSALMYSQV
jgi:hypothetical protein